MLLLFRTLIIDLKLITVLTDSIVSLSEAYFAHLIVLSAQLLSTSAVFKTSQLCMTLILVDSHAQQHSGFCGQND